MSLSRRTNTTLEATPRATSRTRTNPHVHFQLPCPQWEHPRESIAAKMLDRLKCVNPTTEDEQVARGSMYDIWSKARDVVEKLAVKCYHPKGAKESHEAMQKANCWLFKKEGHLLRLLDQEDELWEIMEAIENTPLKHDKSKGDCALVRSLWLSIDDCFAIEADNDHLKVAFAALDDSDKKALISSIGDLKKEHLIEGLQGTLANKKVTWTLGNLSAFKKYPCVVEHAKINHTKYNAVAGLPWDERMGLVDTTHKNNVAANKTGFKECSQCCAKEDECRNRCKDAWRVVNRTEKQAKRDATDLIHEAATESDKTLGKACFEGDRDAVEAWIQDKDNTVDAQTLDRTIFNERSECTKFGKNGLESVNHKDQDHCKVLEGTWSHGGKVNGTATAAYLAARSPNLDVLKLLLENKANPNQGRADGSTLCCTPPATTRTTTQTAQALQSNCY